MTRKHGYAVSLLAIVVVTVMAIPFHIAAMEWLVSQGDAFLSFCGQILSDPGSSEQAPAELR